MQFGFLYTRIRQMSLIVYYGKAGLVSEQVHVCKCAVWDMFVLYCAFCLGLIDAAFCSAFFSGCGRGG